MNLRHRIISGCRLQPGFSLEGKQAQGIRHQRSHPQRNQPQKNHRQRNRGFTLVELMIGLVIVGIGLTVAVPSFQGMIARNRIATQVNEFLVAVNLARSEAGRVGSNVTIQPTGNNAADEFGDGWCVVIGDPGDCNGTLIRRFSALGGASTLNLVTAGNKIQFNSLGALLGGTPVSVDLCDSSSGQSGRRVYITLIGRSKSHRPNDVDSTKRPDCN